MAGDFTPASNHFIDWGNIFAMHNRDYTLSVWARPDGSSNTGYVVGKTTGVNGFYCRRSSADPTAWEFGHINGGTTHFCALTGTVDEDTAQNLIFVYDTGDQDGFLYKNNSLLASNTTMTNQASTTTALGIGNRVANDRDFDGAVWELAIWLDVKLDSTERAKLAARASPLFVSTPPSFYAPLIGDAVDVISATTGTNTNSTPFIAHPNAIFYPPVHTMYRRLRHR